MFTITMLGMVGGVGYFVGGLRGALIAVGGSLILIVISGVLVWGYERLSGPAWGWLGIILLVAGLMALDWVVGRPLRDVQTFMLFWGIGLLFLGFQAGCTFKDEQRRSGRKE